MLYIRITHRASNEKIYTFRVQAIPNWNTIPAGSPKKDFYLMQDFESPNLLPSFTLDHIRYLNISVLPMSVSGLNTILTIHRLHPWYPILNFSLWYGNYKNISNIFLVKVLIHSISISLFCSQYKLVRDLFIMFSGNITLFHMKISFTPEPLIICCNIHLITNNPFVYFI